MAKLIALWAALVGAWLFAASALVAAFYLWRLGNALPAQEARFRACANRTRAMVAEAMPVATRQMRALGVIWSPLVTFFTDQGRVMYTPVKNGASPARMRRVVGDGRVWVLYDPLDPTHVCIDDPRLGAAREMALVRRIAVIVAGMGLGMLLVGLLPLATLLKW